MKIKNVIVDSINHSQLDDSGEVHISNSIINTIDFIGFESNTHVTIENSIIKDFLIHTCWFRKGLIFRANHVINYIDYQMGGHNEAEIIFANNIFLSFFNFFDCQFSNKVIVENNIFLKGTNIVGNVGEGWENFFEQELILRGNVGPVNLDGVTGE